MAFYGYNFDFEVPPIARDRNGQCVAPATGTPIPIGAPIQFDWTKDKDVRGVQPIKLATAGGTGDPRDGDKGILVYEWIQGIGVDPVQTTFSHWGFAPLGAPVQMVSGRHNIVRFHNTVARRFHGSPTVIPGRVMVAGFGPTPSINEGDFLAPGVGNDDDGYWAKVSTVDDAWLQIEGLDHARGDVVARVLV